MGSAEYENAMGKIWGRKLMNQSDIEVVWKILTTIWSELLSFGVVLAGFYAIWLVVSAILKWSKIL